MCIGHGHVEAYLYPIGLVFDEANFIRERETSRMLTEAQLRQALLTSMFTKAKSAFSKLVKKLSMETLPIMARFEDQTPKPSEPIAPKSKPVLPDFVQAELKR